MSSQAGSCWVGDYNMRHYFYFHFSSSLRDANFSFKRYTQLSDLDPQVVTLYPHSITHSPYILQRTLNYNKWTVSPDHKYIMIVHDAITVFRYSSLAKYTVVSVEER